MDYKKAYALLVGVMSEAIEELEKTPCPRPLPENRNFVWNLGMWCGTIIGEVFLFCTLFMVAVGGVDSFEEFCDRWDDGKGRMKNLHDLLELD